MKVLLIDVYNYNKDTMFVDVQNNRSSGRVVPPLAAGRSPTDD